MKSTLLYKVHVSSWTFWVRAVPVALPSSALADWVSAAVACRERIFMYSVSIKPPFDVAATAFATRLCVAPVPVAG